MRMSGGWGIGKWGSRNTIVHTIEIQWGGGDLKTGKFTIELGVQIPQTVLIISKQAYLTLSIIKLCNNISFETFYNSIYLTISEINHYLSLSNLGCT